MSQEVLDVLIPKTKRSLVNGAAGNLLELRSVSSYQHPKLHAHQNLVSRAFSYTKKGLFIHDVGRGKTHCIIAAIERRKLSGELKFAVIVTREVIHSEIERAIRDFGADPTFYKFFTYRTVQNRLPIEELDERFALIVDEIQSLATPSETRNTIDLAFENIMLLRMKNPSLVIAASATPFIYGDKDVRNLYMYLMGVPFGDSRLNQSPDAMLRAIVQEIPVFYEPRLEVARVDLVTQGGDNASEFYNVTMSEAQSRYLEEQHERHSEFLQGIRTASIGGIPIDVNLNIKYNVNDVIHTLMNVSIKMATWLQIDTDARQRGEPGTTAIYVDDIVESGAKLYAKYLMSCSNWEQWRPDSIASDTVNRFLLLTSEDENIAGRQVFSSPENVTGNLIRTVIFSRAFKDGVSFSNCLRFIQEPSTNYFIDIQAAGRVLRTNSFIAMEQFFVSQPQSYIDNFSYLWEKYPASKHGFRMRVRKYIISTNYAGHNTNIRNNILAAGSIERRTKQNSFHEAKKLLSYMDILIKASVDEAIKKPIPLRNLDTSNYLAKYAKMELAEIVERPGITDLRGENMTGFGAVFPRCMIQDVIRTLGTTYSTPLNLVEIIKVAKTSLCNSGMSIYRHNMHLHIPMPNIKIDPNLAEAYSAVGLVELADFAWQHHVIKNAKTSIVIKQSVNTLIANLSSTVTFKSVAEYLRRIETLNLSFLSFNEMMLLAMYAPYWKFTGKNGNVYIGLILANLLEMNSQITDILGNKAAGIAYTQSDNIYSRQINVEYNARVHAYENPIQPTRAKMIGHMRATNHEKTMEKYRNPLQCEMSPLDYLAFKETRLAVDTQNGAITRRDFVVVKDGVGWLVTSDPQRPEFTGNQFKQLHVNVQEHQQLFERLSAEQRCFNFTHIPPQGASDAELIEWAKARIMTVLRFPVTITSSLR